jgi:HAE1 family hydrophobic/amphiphilic exporter-1
VILIGTVVNNPILIVDRALQLVRFEGAEPTDAILEAVQSRIRPIFMTTFTTVLGLLPLVIFPGAGSELYRGLGSVLLGGLLVSTFVTLVLVPLLLGLCLRKPRGAAADQASWAAETARPGVSSAAPPLAVGGR